jgi:hypothetical protein
MPHGATVHVRSIRGLQALIYLKTCRVAGPPRAETPPMRRGFPQNLASRPDAFETNADLGEALLADGKGAEAVPYLEKALALKPDARLRALLDAARRRPGALEP